VRAFKMLNVDQTERVGELDRQLSECKNVQGKMRLAIKEFLGKEHIYSIGDITDRDKIQFRQHLNAQSYLSKKQRKYYLSGIEMLQYSYYRPLHEDFLLSIEKEVKATAELRKVETYLLSHGIYSVEEINYEVRRGYCEYIQNICGSSNFFKYVKVLDTIKLNEIKRLYVARFSKEKRWRYSDRKVFLLYHPNYEVAMTFYYIRDKEELLYDFTLQGGEKLKRQVFSMLNNILENITDRHDRRERFLIPLRLLYEFCIDNRIYDLELLEEEDRLGFSERLKNIGNTLAESYIQIIYNIQKFLFVQARKTNWEANTWYLERFNFQSERMNPSNPVVTINFEQVRNIENRKYLKIYTRYMLGITDRAISNIRFRNYNLVAFMRYCDKSNLSVRTITASNIEGYLKEIDIGIQPNTYNKKLMDIYNFFEFLVVKGFLERVPFIVEYYLQKTILVHNNRSVPEETVQAMLENIHLFPEHLRLMYLHLWSLGLRLNEVCTIKGNAYTQSNGESWIRIYQNKMKAEKVIPIPSTLYELMREYIRNKKISANEYVFQNRKGNAFDVGTFMKYMKNKCLELSINCGEYIFRSHDYRHYINTKLYKNDASLQAIRDFSGHRTEEMTKQYIDYLPEQIDGLNQIYFDEEENHLAQGIRKESNYE